MVSAITVVAASRGGLACTFAAIAGRRAQALAVVAVGLWLDRPVDASAEEATGRAKLVHARAALLCNHHCLR
eukprot:3132983-Pyramimonas_sp.AAC.1